MQRCREMERSVLLAQQEIVSVVLVNVVRFDAQGLGRPLPCPVEGGTMIFVAFRFWIGASARPSVSPFVRSGADIL